MGCRRWEPEKTVSPAAIANDFREAIIQLWQEHAADTSGGTDFALGSEGPEDVRSEMRDSLRTFEP
jgi:hypothetical protein